MLGSIGGAQKSPGTWSPGEPTRRRMADAVSGALAWLAAHQNPDGMWSCGRFSGNCRGSACTGEGSTDEYDMGVTGLAILAFLGAGSTQKDGPYRQNVNKALMAVMLRQADDGCLGTKAAGGRWFYGHAIGTLALTECLGVTLDEGMLQAAAKKAVDFLVLCQNPGKGFRYGIKPGDSDTSCTAWASLALKSAKLAGIQVPLSSIAGARAWFDSVTDPATFRVGYISRGDSGARPADGMKFPPLEAMTAAAVTSRILLGESKDSEHIQGGAKAVMEKLPAFSLDNHTIDMYYWYYGTLAMSLMGGEYFRAWAPAMLDALIPAQMTSSGCDKGSWSPDCVWGKEGGRVYSTAICTLMLETLGRSMPGPKTGK